MVTDILGQPVGPIFKIQAVKEECWVQVAALLCRGSCELRLFIRYSKGLLDPSRWAR